MVLKRSDRASRAKNQREVNKNTELKDAEKDQRARNQRALGIQRGAAAEIESHGVETQ